MAAALLNAGGLPFLALIFFGGGTPLSESEDESSEELLLLSEDGELDVSELEELSAQAPRGKRGVHMIAWLSCGSVSL